MKLFDKVLVSTLALAPKWVVWPFAKPYVAGPTLDDALVAVRRLNSEGCVTTVDVLGEFITRTDEAIANTDKYTEVLQALERSGLETNISVKPTALGLKLDTELAYQNIDRICALAAERGGFVRLDMEDSTCTQDTIDLYFRLREKYDRVGIVLQAYLHRTFDDAKRLGEAKANIRFCKGIYTESPDIAIKSHQGIRDNYMKTLDLLLKAGSYVGIATHDDWLVEGAERLVKELGLAADRYEFQMLIGVRPELRRRLVATGARVRVYVPFGKDWHAYSMRRMKENPQIAKHIIKALIRKG